jgi:phosphate butyryltransferase
MLKSAKMVMERARELAAKRRPVVAIAGAEDDDVLRAVSEAVRAGIVGATLVGQEVRIHALLEELGEDRNSFEIVNAENPKAVIALSVELCSSGRAQILMKGKVSTPDLMKAVLSPRAGLKVGKLLSHCAVLEATGYHKLLSITDGGVLSNPDFNDKLAIVENAVHVSRVIGVAEPKVGLLGVMNEPDPDFPSTIEAAAVARSCYVKGMTKYIEGPLTMGTIFRQMPEGATWKSDVVGDADILVAHSIEEANIAVKALINLRGAIFMGVITGAKVPLSLVSRADPPENKLASLALAAVISGASK